jgi:hypothetical protein
VNTVARLMRADHLRARRPKRFRLTTNSSHAWPVAENLLGRDFSATVPNQKWVADITFIPTGEGWLYLAVELDLRVMSQGSSQRGSYCPSASYRISKNLGTPEHVGMSCMPSMLSTVLVTNW